MGGVGGGEGGIALARIAPTAFDWQQCLISHTTDDQFLNKTETNHTILAPPELLPHLQDKIFEISTSSDDTASSKITSYFSLSESEKQEIISILGSNSIEFHSIFSNVITDEQWDKTKDQIKKKFNDELFDIDDTWAYLIYFIMLEDSSDYAGIAKRYGGRLENGYAQACRGSNPFPGVICS